MDINTEEKAKLREKEEQLWHDTFVALARGTFHIDRSSTANWADYAVERFRKKFNNF